MPEFEPVIGLEVHAQLRTRTKIFCGCEVRFGRPPNSLTCPVCLGMPGALPVLNREAVALAVRLGLALGCAVRPRSIFARKNYFYPDLPKGYQISQFDLPLAEHGRLAIEARGESREARVRRVHMEEDAGKLIHEGPLAVPDATLVDFNRSGVPLIEIVGEPDLRSPEEAYDYLTRLKSLLTYTEVCDGNMEEGSLRCDANVSIRERGSSDLGTRVELKNLNSFRNVERALQYEIAHQEETVRQGREVVQETKLYDADKHITRPMRSKEEAHDYRYFPDPDLLPLVVGEAWIEEIRATLPELPAARKERFVRDYALSVADAALLTLEKPLADYFEAAVFGIDPEPGGVTRAAERVEGGISPMGRAPHADGAAKGQPAAPPRAIAKLVLREIMTKRKDEALDAEALAGRYPARYLTELVTLQESGAVNGPTASEVFEFSWAWAAGERRADDATSTSKSVLLLGFGRKRPERVEVPAADSIRAILDSEGASAEGLMVGLNGRLVADLEEVPSDGAVLVGIPPVAGATSRPAEVSARPAKIVAGFGLAQISDEAAILRAVDEAVGANPKQLEQYRKGKTALFGFFVGQVMRAMGGRANTALVTRLLEEKLRQSA